VEEKEAHAVLMWCWDCPVCGRTELTDQADNIKEIECNSCGEEYGIEYTE
jgi:transcription elongation factor Elf1